MTHPLTDEMIEEIAQFDPDLTDPIRLNRDYDMRAAYDKGFEDALAYIMAEGLAHYSAIYEAHENFYNNRS